MSATPTLADGQESHFVEELHGEKGKPAVVKRPRGRRPSDIGASGPNLSHDVGDLGRELPAADEIPNAVGTHDVNHEMIAKAYRPGLRVGIGRSTRPNSLDFLFGS